MKYMMTIALLGTLFTANPAWAGFQKTEWYDSPKEVIAKQNIPKDKRVWDRGSPQSTLMHETTFAGANAVIGYVFVSRKLVRVTVAFTDTHIQKTKHLEDFDQIDAKLARVYGEAELQAKWSGDLYKDTPNKYGIAVAVGDLSMHTLRISGDLKVLHMLKGGNFEIRHTLSYFTDETFKSENAALDRAHDADL